MRRRVAGYGRRRFHRNGPAYSHRCREYVLARAGLDRFTPRATLICVVAANIPDIDIVTASSPINYLNYHRHLTHAIARGAIHGERWQLLLRGRIGSLVPSEE